MANQRTLCHPQQIERLLDDALTDAEQAALESHLDDCPLCRHALQAAAAEPSMWRSARQYLSDAEESPAARDSAAPADADGADADRAAPDGTETRRAEAENADDRQAHIDGGMAAVVGQLAPSDDPRMLGRLGGYEIVGVVGCGGMGVVLKGFDAPLNRYVAIKVLAPHLASSGAARQRFAREARAAAAVVHENVVAIHAVAETDRVPFFVMPYVRGTSLQTRLDREGPLHIVEILRVSMQVAAGLAAAHAQGLVHRDIKPANILLEDGVERLLITDFGLARAADDASLTRSGVIAGTPQYMSPEQARGEAVDERSDLFSLGSVMYAMCTGHPPFRAETSYGVLRRIGEDAPRPVTECNRDIPPWLAAIVARLLSKQPGDRFRSAASLEHLLQQCLAHVQRPSVAPLPSELQDEQPAPLRRRLVAPAVGFTGAIMLAGACLWAVGAFRHEDAPVQASSNKEPAVRDQADDHASAYLAAEGETTDWSSEEIPSEASLDWRDGVAAELLEIDAELRSFEQRSLSGWEAAPNDASNASSSNAKVSNANTPQANASEVDSVHLKASPSAEEAR